MSILARSGGIRDEFTFTGGVAKNEAAVKALNELVKRTTASSRSTSTPTRSTPVRWAAPPSPGARWWKKARPRKPAPEDPQGAQHHDHTIGIDIGSGAVKTVLFRSPDDGGRRVAGQALRAHPPPRPHDAGPRGLRRRAGRRRPQARDIAYTATTGEGENVKFSTGHFYSMTTHARGGVFLDPAARAVVDIGALNGRAISVDERGKVLSYKMTSQCASGSGQFLENIARYLGVAVEEIGPLSRTSQDPEKVSSICAVLAETDVINMVSRGIATPDILKGIHLSMASRIVKLLKVTGVKGGVALLTGGLALDTGLLAAIQEEMVNEKVKVEAVSHPDSIYAGAIGAALWGAYRHER
jgi:benzoyl-CoA reductase subunit D